MAKVNYVQRSRNELGCGRCSDIIPKGSPYMHATPGFRGTKMVRCMKCAFRPSELTTSKMSEAYAAQEDLEDAIAEWSGDEIEDLQSELENAADRARAVADEYTDANDQWTMNGAADNDEWVERAEALEAWADELDVMFEDRPEADADDPDQDLADEIQIWIDDSRQLAEDACNSLEV